MTREVLADNLQELALLIRRDGTLLAHFGGRGVDWLCPSPACYEEARDGPSIHSLWSPALADLLLRLVRRAISIRGMLDSEFLDGERCCEIQMTAHSPDTAICTIRPAVRPATDATRPQQSGPAGFDRRGFMRRLKTSLSIAALNEKPLALAIIELEGIAALSKVLDSGLSGQVIGAAVHRLPSANPAGPAWYISQLSQNLLVLVVEACERTLIEACIAGICASLREPVHVGDAQFTLTPHAGVAILGRDATSAKQLLDHAKASAVEARRSGDQQVCFFSDTLRLRSLARLDVARELHDAISNRDIGLRYVPRHDLASGRLTALVAYLQWQDPMRGQVAPTHFLSIAEATGLAVPLSRSVLERLKEDFIRLHPTLTREVRVSFGALRQHVLDEGFVADLRAILDHGALTADRLELRISERAYISRESDVWHGLANLGVQLVVDEFGRDLSSLGLLARVPLWGLQLDRSLTTAVNADPVSDKVCRALVNVATGLGLVPIATGVDSESQRERLAGYGCRQGLGDLYPLRERPERVSTSQTAS